jgi:hypothetical protein
MKKKIHKIWGLGLVVVLAASLLLSAAPVSAGTLSWGDEDLPDELEMGNITDLAVFPGGGVIYAAHDMAGADGVVFRSTNRGESWSSITVVDGSNVMTNPTFVAVTPDDENYIAVANATGGVFISSDAGANWDTLGDALTTNGVTVNDLALSPEKGGKHTVAIAGTDAPLAEVWHYEIGAVGADWTETSGDSGFAAQGGNVTGAVAFSPNFASDEVLVAVTADYNDAVWLHIYSFNQDNWNTGTFSDYPAEVVNHGTDSVVTALDSASIAMAPDFLGSDDAMRVLFVGVTTDSSASSDEASGIFRMDDDESTTLKDEVFIHSVDYDGTNLVAGEYDSTNVRRSSDPLASSPSVSSTSSTKRAGGDHLTLAAFAGSEVVAGTSGDESAFAISRDDGKTFNDISLIDTTLETLCDVAVTPDGESVYLISANDTTNLSVWRYVESWERVFSMQNAANDYIVRLAPDDDEVVYLADVGGTSIYYSSDGGDEKWHTRVSRYSVTDLAIEGDGDVAYVLTGPHVSKSTNSGFTWATKKSHKISSGGNMIVSVGEVKLLVGGVDGTVSYSTDGNETWTKLSDGIGSYSMQTVATGLADGDFIFAAVEQAGEYIYRWEIGEDDEWDAITADDYLDETGTDYSIYGLVLEGGVLYAVGDNTSDSKMFRTLNPTDDDPSWSTKTSPGETFSSVPSTLRVSVSGDVTKLWTIDTTSAAMDLFSYKDTLAIVGPTSKTPADGADIDMNPVSGEAFHLTLTWETPSDGITKYNLRIALDSDFDEEVLSSAGDITGDWDEGDIVSAVCGPGAAYSVSFMPHTTYYWRVRVDAAGPVKSAWSEVRSFNIGELPEQLEPVIIQQPPAPVISVPPAPAITIEPPEIVLPPSPAPPPDIVIPSPPAAPAPITPAFIWAIVIIGAILVIALVVLIIRTRRPV